LIVTDIVMEINVWRIDVTEIDQERQTPPRLTAFHADLSAV